MIPTHRPAIPLVALHPDARQRKLDFSSVLFLDIDGVLHPEGCEPLDHFCFAPAFCEIMHSVDPEGTLPIVITSMWRHTYMIDELRSSFSERVALQIVGVTPNFAKINPGKSHALTLKMNALSGVSSRPAYRQIEVMNWMADHAPNGRWLAIDDRAEYFEEECRHLFEVRLNNGANGANGALAQDQWAALVNGVQARAFAAAGIPIPFPHMAERIARFRDTTRQDGNLPEAQEKQRSSRP
jgi:hypothetical protein